MYALSHASSWPSKGASANDVNWWLMSSFYEKKIAVEFFGKKDANSLLLAPIYDWKDQRTTQQSYGVNNYFNSE